ncbi:unnamed protein product [Diatraea saccharalis]|uniref:Uncharacterized protein n=1 Tax=Diatraea saccharalis TaxID=40085 RepID=A0A9N9RC46_9NEOP|nr:unnamed protein product [Diatraea saccharalis]
MRLCNNVKFHEISKYSALDRRLAPLALPGKDGPASSEGGDERVKSRARFGSAPDLRAGNTRAVSASALRRPLRRYALSVDEPPHSAVSNFSDFYKLYARNSLQYYNFTSASAAESECGSQSSLALDLHGSGSCAGVTLRVCDNTRRRPLARQQRLRDDTIRPVVKENVNNAVDLTSSSNNDESINDGVEMVRLSCEEGEREMQAASALPVAAVSPPPSPRPIPPISPQCSDTCILIEESTSEATEVPLDDV